MTPFELQKTLESLTLLLDTREQETSSLKRRLKDIGMPHKREKLNFGDYSCELTMPDGSVVRFDRLFAVERKMSIDELASCFTSQRKRFTAEFERAKQAGAKIYLLIEGATMEKIVNGKYRSRVSPNALMASIFAFLVRYNCQILFCNAETSGRVIKEILYREAKEYLQDMEVEKDENH